MAKRLPSGLQIRKFRDLFISLNPDEDPQTVDFKHTLDGNAEYGENLEELEKVYPFFNWEPKAKITARTYEKEIVADLKQQADEFGYDVVKAYKLKRLEGAGRQAEKWKAALEKCEGLKPTKPKKKRKKRTCPEASKVWIKYKVCPRVAS